MLSRNRVSVRLVPTLVDLSSLLSVLGGFQISRFAVRPLGDDKPSGELKLNLTSFALEVQHFALGETRTWGWGWAASPQIMDCWSFNETVLNLVRQRFPEWLSLAHPEVRWSFFQGTNLASDIPGDGTAAFVNLLSGEMTELRLLGLDCAIEDLSRVAHGDPERDAVHRQARSHFGPHVVMAPGYAKIHRPFWWTTQDDTLILRQVNREQWRWKPRYQDFIKELTKGELERHIAEWQQLCTKGETYGVWYNGLGAYIRKRAIELGAPALVHSGPETKICSACGEEFHETSARMKYFGTGQVDICTPCIDEVLRGAAEDLSPNETLDYLRDLAAILGRPPESDYGREAKKIFTGLDSSERASLIHRMQKRPTLRLVNNQFGSWFNALKEAGLLDQEAQRRVIGTRCLATDGHVCLSLAEKQIDDVLSSLGIPHIREVQYRGRQFRADFMVGEIVIEYFGLMDRPEYKAKAEEKQRYCTENNVPFLALYPEDVLEKNVLASKLKRAVEHLN